MLVNLHITNLAVIKSASVDFSSGFTALTGETGAGKSVLMGGLSLLLGGRTDKGILRTGAEQGGAVALFANVSSLAEKKLQALDIFPDEEGNYLLSRMVTADGRSVSKINGKPTTLAILKDAGAALFTIHGQNDTRELSDNEGERILLDESALSPEALQDYKKAYERYTALRRTLTALEKDEEEKDRMQEVLRFQLEDIMQVSPKEGEDEELLDQKLLLKNAGKIQKQAAFAYRALRGAEKGNAIYIVDRAESALRTLSEMVPEAEEIAEKLAECVSSLEDAAERLQDMLALSEEDPEDALEWIEGRLAAIERLCRKYGGSISAVCAFAEKIKAKLERYENAQEEIAQTKTQLKEAEKECLALAEKLHEARVRCAKEASVAVTETLHFLDMPKAIFTISVQKRAAEHNLDEYGIDDIQFLLAANIGEDPKPVAKAASGGELARIMLAIRKHLSAKNDVGTMVYDEVDTGVSGKTARKIGLLLRETATKGQVFCITHSAQVASLANTHLMIQKQEKDGRAESRVVVLDREGRIDELSRILGGIQVTEAQRLAAIDMLSERE